MSTPAIYVDTGYTLDDRGRIISTREPSPRRGPVFLLVRSTSHNVCAVRADVRDDVADALLELADREPLVRDLRDRPLHETRYRLLVDDHLATHRPGTRAVQHGGPALMFSDGLSWPSGIVSVEDERILARHFPGWTNGEIAAGRSPLLAVVEGGHAVSICFSARRSRTCAEAGLETATAFRGRGLAARVTAAWALSVRTAGLVPLYSTFWSNHASLAVTRRLGLEAYASTWGLSEAPP